MYRRRDKSRSRRSRRSPSLAQQHQQHQQHLVQTNSEPRGGRGGGRREEILLQEAGEGEGGRGYLPLHLAAQLNATDEVLRLVAQANPGAVEVTNQAGKLPDELSENRSHTWFAQKAAYLERCARPSAWWLAHTLYPDLFCVGGQGYYFGRWEYQGSGPQGHAE